MLYYLFCESQSRQCDADVLLLKQVAGQLRIHVHPICNNLTQPMFLGNSPAFFLVCPQITGLPWTVHVNRVLEGGSCQDTGPTYNPYNVNTTVDMNFNL